MVSIPSTLLVLTVVWVSIWCDHRVLSPSELIGQKKWQLISSMNIVVAKKNITIPSNNKCSIIILWSVWSLEAILTCNEQRLLLQNVKIKDGTPYQTTITDITVWSHNKLDISTGCMVMKESNITIVYPHGCSVPLIDEDIKNDLKITT